MCSTKTIKRTNSLPIEYISKISKNIFLELIKEESEKRIVKNIGDRKRE